MTQSQDHTRHASAPVFAKLLAGTVYGSHGSPNNSSPLSNMHVSTKNEINIGFLESTFFHHVKYSEKMKTRRFTYATHELALKILIPIKCKNDISSGESTFDLISTDIQWRICGLGRKRFSSIYSVLSEASL